jgi:hypothetical protein
LSSNTPFDGAAIEVLDPQGNPVVVKTVQEVTAKVVGYSISDLVDQNGMINQDLADEFDGSIDTLKQKYPAIIRTECPRIPGPAPGDAIGLEKVNSENRPRNGS